MNDRLVVLSVVFFLGFVSLAVVGGAIALRFDGQDAPGELWGFGGVALGAIAGLLASTKTNAAPAEPPKPPEGG